MVSPEERSIRSICVVGGGIVGLSAAIAFSRALPSANVRILAVPPDPAALADRLTSSLPTIGRALATAGLDELDLVRNGIATHRLGTRFEHWSPDDQPWYHVFGDYGLPAGSIAFHHLWARARKERRALPYHRYAAAAALAAAGKFIHPDGNPRSALSTYLYSLRLDPERYRDRLAAHSRAQRIEQDEGELGAIERREDGGIAALVLKDGRRMGADLLIDAAGPSAPLLAAVGGQFEDWSVSLPCDRLLLGSTPAPPALSSCDFAATTSIGWRWSSPITDRAVTGVVYASGITSDERAHRILRSETPLEAAEAVSIRPGRWPEPWRHNVLAIGDAAIAVDPLHGTNLHLAQSSIIRALELLPGRDCHPLELREYNRRTAQETMRVRDFLAVHYLRSPRKSGEFWESIAGRALPESLAHTLEQFEARGRLPFYEEETFDKQSWLAALIGLGILPRHMDAAAAGVDPESSLAAMQRLSDGMSGLPDRLPAYRDYLARMKAAPVR